MYTPQRLIDLSRALTGTILLATATMALAAEPPANQAAAPSKEMRDQMAAVHQRMAACLRSEKPIAECREEMRRNCAKFMGEQDCPMMGMGGRMMPREDR